MTAGVVCRGSRREYRLSGRFRGVHLVRDAIWVDTDEEHLCLAVVDDWTVFFQDGGKAHRRLDYWGGESLRCEA